MDVLNAAGLAPVSLHKAGAPSADRKSEPKRIFLFRLPRVAALSSVLGVASSGGLAKALNYEEALGQSISGSSLDIDLGGALDGLVSFVSENPLVVGGGALALAVPLVLSQLLQKPKNWGVVTAKNAYAKLSEELETQLLDIREGKDIKEVGSPDVRSLKKKAFAIAFKRDDKQGFLQKIQLKFKDPANTTLFILDKFDGNSELVAELVTANGFKAAFAIRDGAEGPRGWKNSTLPWLQPKKGLNVDFGDLISSTLGEGSDGLPVTLGIAAATGLGIFAFTEIETVLQLLGSAAIIQFVTKKLLFAQDRKVTLQQIDEFLNTKVAPKELVDEIKTIGKSFLPSSTSEIASLAASAEANPELPASSFSYQEVKEQAPTETPAEDNSAPIAEAKEEPAPVPPRPLSPYPYYPELKPPSSPSPSAP